MNKRYFIFGIFLSTLVISSCLKDLDVKPKDPNTILAGNLGDSAIYLKQTLGKVYASFIISGQGSNGGDDITASNADFFTTTRALWNLQEITTDEAICGWGDVGIADLNTQTWSPQNPFLTALFQRLSLSITYANQYIRFTNGNMDPDVIRYNAEARFLRALAYTWAIDLFGKFPFTTDDDPVGKFFPIIKDRTFLFNYVETELLAIEEKLGEPGFSYPQADKGACWMLLARLYLNAEVFTGTPRWDDCKTYTDKVINSDVYDLATNYRQNFSADNGGDVNPEMIFSWAQDGVNTQGYVGSTFIIESTSDAVYIRAERFHGLTSNTNWNGNRTKRNFVNLLVDTLATYGNVPVPKTDSTFSQCKDKRVFLKTKKSWDIPSPSSSGDYGIGVYKFTALNTDTATEVINYNPAYASTDFPIFRLADAYLMRAEALFNLGDEPGALEDVNLIRDRAFQAGSFGSNPANHFTSLSEQILLDERGREFYFEGQRRTDLVRFGKFTDGGYMWEWKGGTASGIDTDSHLNIFPIPGDEIASNPNYKGQNNIGY